MTVNWSPLLQAAGTYAGGSPRRPARPAWDQRVKGAMRRYARALRAPLDPQRWAISRDAGRYRFGWGTAPHPSRSRRVPRVSTQRVGLPLYPGPQGHCTPPYTRLWWSGGPWHPPGPFRTSEPGLPASQAQLWEPTNDAPSSSRCTRTSDPQRGSQTAPSQPREDRAAQSAAAHTGQKHFTRRSPMSPLHTGHAATTFQGSSKRPNEHGQMCSSVPSPRPSSHPQ